VLSRKEIDVPLVLTSHGSDVMASHTRYRDPSILERATRAMREVDVMIALSNTMKSNFLEMCPEGTPVVEISNGVDLKEFQREAPRPAMLDPLVVPGRYVLFLGRLTKRKGVDTLLFALAKVPARGGVELVIAGYGRERKALEALAARLGLGTRTRFVGAVSGADKSYLLQHAAATVVPTRTWEACSLVVLESFASGTPVIGSNIQGIKHFINPGLNGRLFTAGSGDELAEILRGLWDDPSSLALWREGARRSAAELDWDKIAQRHLRLYEELIAKQESNAVAGNSRGW
jgi:glycosyltransferase involved in cell wall biosynthesis